MQFFGYRKLAPDGKVDIQPDTSDADLKAAYDRGRHDEKLRHRRRPLVTLAVAAVALTGAAVVGLAMREGSFAEGGQVVDQQLSVAADQAEVASRDAAAATGEAVRDAAENLRSRSERAS
jgi:hypothetical protein